MPGDLLAALALTWSGNGAPILAACRFLLVLPRATRAPRIERLDSGSRREASARGGALSSDAPARLDISRDVDAARAREALHEPSSFAKNCTFLSCHYPFGAKLANLTEHFLVCKPSYKYINAKVNG